ncbi:MAG: HAD family hydrolase [Clostridium sp.]|nr:HAD family hydrolase [Clostridium sp.]
MADLVLFDVGGTLMEYEGMPLNWCDYYYRGFRNIADGLKFNISESDINEAVEIMKRYNPRIVPREYEISPKEIFRNFLKGWERNIDLAEAANAFFMGLKLQPKIYEDSIAVMNKLKSRGIIVGLLTDLPTAMPDNIFLKDIKPIVDIADIYISSQSCGYRKPNPKGILYAGEQYNVPVKDILFVGDEEKDRITAQNAGCSFKMINRKYQSLEQII